MSPILALIKKEFLIDYKDRQVWMSVFLYVLATDYVVYQSFHQVKDAEVWNALLWVIILFAAFNVISRSYDQERGDREIYLYTLASPQQVIITKMLYQSLFMVLVTSFSFLVYSFFLPFPAAAGMDTGLYLIGLLGGAVGLSTTLGLVSAISWKTKGGPGMVAILGLPIIIPMILAIIRYTEGVVNGMAWVLLQSYALVLLVLIGIGAGLGYILFPYIWKE